VTPLGASSQRL